MISVGISVALLIEEYFLKLSRLLRCSNGFCCSNGVLSWLQRHRFYVSDFISQHKNSE